MRWLLLGVLVVVVSAGCSPGRTRTTEEIANLVAIDSGLFEVRLEALRANQEPRFTEYYGSALDSEGIAYDLSVDVTRNEACWWARPRPRFLPKDRAEEVAAELLQLTDVSLIEERPGAFNGFGFDASGTRQRLRGTSGEDFLFQRVFVIKICDDEGFMVRSECFYEKLPSYSGTFELPR